MVVDFSGKDSCVPIELTILIYLMSLKVDIISKILAL